METKTTPRSPLFNKTERLTRKQKKAGDYAWYKDKADFYETEAESFTFSEGENEVTEFKRMMVNYNLFNNILNVEDLAYVCTPFGEDVGELPATMANRDISSYRIKALIGMEMRRPFGYKLLAVNKEATTRKEEEYFNRIREFVVDSIMTPIKIETEKKYAKEVEGRELEESELRELQEKMQMEIEEKTPERVKRYMKRDHQDPAEVQGHQILEFLQRELRVRRLFNQGWKHALLSAYEIYWVGIVNKRPTVKVVNPIRFRCPRSEQGYPIQDRDWAVVEYRMSPSEVSMTFNLDKHEEAEIREQYRHRISSHEETSFFENKHSISNFDDYSTIPVKHIVFKAPRKVGWLTYEDPETGEIMEDFIVDEEYKLNPEQGDLQIEWEWINEVYEVWKIGKDIYKNMGPIKGQHKDENNIYTCKLPYYGEEYDDTNSTPTSIMDRMKGYQYYYNIIMYRLELLLASDEGKKILMNINAIPSDSGIDIEKWQYFFKSTPFMWYNPNEEGMTNQDVNTIAKTLDLSLASDIGKYIEFAEYLEQKCGKSVGVTDPVLGQTAVSERVTNNQQNLVQTGHILEPYFDVHNNIKKEVLQALLDTAKVAYVSNPDEVYLSFVLDDMSTEMLKVDKELLEANSLGLFMEDSSMAEEAKQTIRQLSHAAMQNQKVELSDVLKVIKHESVQEAEEELLVAEERRVEREQKKEQESREHELKIMDRQQELLDDKHEKEKEIVVLKEQERRKTVIQQQAMLSVGFNEDKDMDGDGILDVLEIANQGVDADIKIRDSYRKDRELAHRIADDKEKNAIKRDELKRKINAPK